MKGGRGEAEGRLGRGAPWRIGHLLPGIVKEPADITKTALIVG